MPFKRLRPLAVIAALTLASSAPAQTVPQYTGPAGTKIPAQGVIEVNQDGTLKNGPTTDGSGAIAAGGTAQALFGGATPLNGWKIALPSAAPSSFVCWASDTTSSPSASTPGSYPVYAGGQYSTEPGQKPLGPVYLNCPTTATPFSAQSW